MRRLAACVAVLAIAGCGDDGPADDAVDPTSVPTFTAEEVCALVPAELVGNTLGVADVEAEEAGNDIGACSYVFTDDDGATTNLATQVLRPADLGGNAGADGFEYATSFEISDTAYEPVGGVGDRAAVVEAPGITQLVVLAGGQVLTLATQADVDVEQLAAVADLMAEALAG